MDEKRITNSNIRRINQNRVYQAIYQADSVSKFQLVQTLEMGLSTVSANLNQLLDAGLIKYDGYFASTGGRKANIIRIVPDARVAIGIAILIDRIHYVAIDLRGHIMYKNTVPMDYISKTDYYQDIGLHLQVFIYENAIPKQSILGVTIATQGIVSRDGSGIDYGVIMGNAQMTLEDFQPYIPYPCRMEHDSKAAAFQVLWKHPDIENAAVLILNHNLGGAIISNHIVQTGDHMRGGLIEHICIDPDGPVCYCGKKGCLETFCSADTLERKSGMDIASFFAALRAGGSGDLNRIWETYLEKLALTIRNMNMLFDGTFFLIGYLVPYFNDDDVNHLLDLINSRSPFPLDKKQLQLGASGQYTSAQGGALYYIKQFLESV